MGTWTRLGVTFVRTLHVFFLEFIVIRFYENALGSYTVKKNAEPLVAATKEIGLEVNAHKTKYMTVFRDQNAVQIHSMKMDNSSIERVGEFKYLGTTLLTYLLTYLLHGAESFLRS